MNPVNDIRIFPITDYNEIVESTYAAVRRLGDLKGAEYAGDIDRLANFRRNGRDLEAPYELIWRVYAGKHWDAITQYVKDVNAERPQRERLESLDGRVDDLITYLILFKCMLREAETKATLTAQRQFKAEPPLGGGIGSSAEQIDGH